MRRWRRTLTSSYDTRKTSDYSPLAVHFTKGKKFMRSDLVSKARALWLAARGLVVKEKMASNNLGRPKFTYHVPSAATKQVTAALQNPHEVLVTLNFSRLRHVCRFEKGGYCKEAKKNCGPQNCPQTRK